MADKKIIIIEHTENEGPGLVTPFFDGHGWECETVRLWKDDTFPASLEEVAAVIALGGPMNVYEEESYPFLRDEDAFVTRLIVDEIPFLGICLGAQVLAKSCGAAVVKAHRRELGWYTVYPTADGRKDSLLRGLPQKIKVFQWHEDTFQVPEGGTLIAMGKACRNQAFKIGRNAYGIQFHIETTPDMVAAWVAQQGNALDGERILSCTAKVAEEFFDTAQRLLDNFKAIIESSLRIRRVIKLFVEDEKSKRRKRPIFWWLKGEENYVQTYCHNFQ